jgi:hypothetical protein
LIFSGINGVIPQKTELFTVNALRASKPRISALIKGYKFTEPRKIT